MQFFDKSQPNIFGPNISPAPFDAANFEKSPEIPETSSHSVKLDSLQLHSFNNSDRIKFTSWYDRNDFIDNNDTILAHYPVDLLITLIGVVQGKNED
jgi:hypothetical protein